MTRLTLKLSWLVKERNCGSDSFVLEITGGVVSSGACRITRLNLASLWKKPIINPRSKQSHAVYRIFVCAEKGMVIIGYG